MKKVKIYRLCHYYSQSRKKNTKQKLLRANDRKLELLVSLVDYLKPQKLFFLRISTKTSSFLIFKSNIYSTVEKNAEQEYNDGRYSLFFNTKAYLKEKNIHRKNFLAFVNGEKTCDKSTEAFSKQIENIKTNKEWRMDYMNLALKFDDMHNMGYEQGLEQVVKNALQEGLDIAVIEKLTGLTETQIKAIPNS